MISAEALKQIATLSKENPSEEVCGYVVLDKDQHAVVTAANEHPLPKESFRIGPKSWLAAGGRGRVIALYHSHPEGDGAPSSQDRLSCNRLKLPYLIYSVKLDRFKLLQPEPLWKEIEGMPWSHGNCLDILRRYFKLIHDIELPAFCEFLSCTEEGFEREKRDLVCDGAKPGAFLTLPARHCECRTFCR
jgi:proteasome lid subunit RPN8/RPN11